MSVHRHIPVSMNTSQTIAGTRVTYLAHDFRPAFYDHERADNDDVSDHEILMRIDCAYSRLHKRRQAIRQHTFAAIISLLFVAVMSAAAGVIFYG